MKKSQKTNRRNFLLAAGLGGAGVAAAVVAPGRKQVAGAAQTATGEPSGYHVTDHILKYYKTTQV